MAKKTSLDSGIDPQNSWYETTPSETNEELDEFFGIAVNAFGAEKLLADHAAGVRSEKGKENARRRHEMDNDGKQAAKKLVYECWLEWQKYPSRYKSKDAFATDMLGKQDSLINHRHITNLCREWENSENK